MNYVFIKDGSSIATRTSLKSAKRFLETVQEDTGWSVELSIPSERILENISLDMFRQYTNACRILNENNETEVNWLLDEFITNIELERICVKLMKRVYHHAGEVYRERHYEYKTGDRIYW